MNIKYFSSFFTASILFFLSGCSAQEPVISEVYEKCCGAEPIEFTYKDGYMFVPNVFTPNGDGVNDYFVPQFNDKIDAYFDTYLIYTSVGDTVLYYFSQFDVKNSISSTWDGNRKDGTPYVGAFKYEFSVYLKSTDGSTDYFTIEGRACRVACGPDASVLKGKSGCFFPSQFNTDILKPDASIPNKEEACFE